MEKIAKALYREVAVAAYGYTTCGKSINNVVAASDSEITHNYAIFI